MKVESVQPSLRAKKTVKYPAEEVKPSENA